MNHKTILFLAFLFLVSSCTRIRHELGKGQLKRARKNAPTLFENRTIEKMETVSLPFVIPQIETKTDFEIALFKADTFVIEDERQKTTIVKREPDLPAPLLKLIGPFIDTEQIFSVRSESKEIKSEAVGEVLVECEVEYIYEEKIIYRMSWKAWAAIGLLVLTLLWSMFRKK